MGHYPDKTDRYGLLTMSDLYTLIKTLDGMKKAKTEHIIDPLEKRLNSLISIALYLIGLFSIALIFILSFYGDFWFFKKEYILRIKFNNDHFWLYFMSLFLIFMFLQITVSCYFRFNQKDLPFILCQIEHDKVHIEKLVQFETSVLQEGMEWINLRTARLHDRVRLIFGNPEKITVFSVIIVVFSLLMAQLGAEEKSSWFYMLTQQKWFSVLLLFLGGVIVIAVFGAISQNRERSRYQYRLELLSMALKRKEAMERCALDA